MELNMGVRPNRDEGFIMGGIGGYGQYGGFGGAFPQLGMGDPAEFAGPLQQMSMPDLQQLSAMGPAFGGDEFGMGQPNFGMLNPAQMMPFGVTSPSSAFGMGSPMLGGAYGPPGMMGGMGMGGMMPGLMGQYGMSQQFMAGMQPPMGMGMGMGGIPGMPGGAYGGLGGMMGGGMPGGGGMGLGAPPGAGGLGTQQQQAAQTLALQQYMDNWETTVQTATKIEAAGDQVTSSILQNIH
jgi:hypothetical protein